MFLFVLSLISASAEFPICTASGNQLYPDVCWDGSAFWVVWQDDEQGTIRGVRVNEDGELLTDEVELLEKGADPGPVRYPCIAAAPDKFAVEARVMVGYNEFGTELWGVMHQEFSFSGESLNFSTARIPESFDLDGMVSTPVVLFGKEHFFSFHTRAFETPEDAHRASVCVGLDDGGEVQQDIWMSSTIWLDWQPSTACWNGDSFLVILTYWGFGAFLSDTLLLQGIGGQFEFERPYWANDHTETVKFQSFVSNGSRYLFLSEANWHSRFEYKIGFDILDSTGMPIKDSAIIIDLGDEIKLYYPDATYGKENFVCCWENRFDDNTVHLYAIEVDTLGEILDSGYVRYDAPVEQQPAIAFGNESYLLVWSDNKDGDFNIRGLVFDTLELFDGISEPATPPLTHPATIAVDQTVFTDVLKINLSAAAAGGTVIIHDALGRVVKRIEVEGRSYSCVWDGRDSRENDAGEGVYFVSLAGKTRNARLKVIKIK